MLTFVDNGGVALCVERRGRGAQHVLLLHGWISARRMWYEVAERLDPERFTLHMLDFRGSGLSDRPEHGHDLDGYASDALAAMNAIGEPLLLVGHSMGGKIGQYVATQRPPALRKLLLVAPGSAHSVRLNERHRALSLDAYGSRKKIEAFQRAAMGVPVPASVMLRVVDDALVGQRDAWFGWYDRGRTADFHDRLPQISVPTLCIGGAKDPLAPVSRLRRDVAQAIPGCLFVTLRNAGHNLPIEAPDEIAGAIARFA